MYEYTKCVRDTDASMHEAAPAHTLTSIVALIAYATLSFMESKTNTDMQQTVKRAQYDGCSACFLVCNYVQMMKPSNGLRGTPLTSNFYAIIWTSYEKKTPMHNMPSAENTSKTTTSTSYE